MSDSDKSDISDLAEMQEARAREQQELGLETGIEDDFQLVQRARRRNSVVTPEPRTFDMIRAAREEIVIREPEYVREMRHWVEVNGDGLLPDPVSILSSSHSAFIQISLLFKRYALTILCLKVLVELLSI